MLIFADRSGLDHAHTVTDFAGVILIVRLEFCHPSKHFPIERVNHRTLDFDDHGLVHLIADHTPNPFTALIY
jgi:hypothetical protein